MKIHTVFSHFPGNLDSLSVRLSAPVAQPVRVTAGPRGLGEKAVRGPVTCFQPNEGTVTFEDTRHQREGGQKEGGRCFRGTRPAFLQAMGCVACRWHLRVSRNHWPPPSSPLFSLGKLEFFFLPCFWENTSGSGFPRLGIARRSRVWIVKPG